MGIAERRALIKKIESLRGSKVICYLTSFRPNVPAQISDDAVRIFFDHLQLLPTRDGTLDIFLCSDGGNATVPWRLIPTCREFASKIGVLVPYRAYSAATQIALGADEIVMHPFGELGPVDPAVANAFNPRDKRTNEIQRINVEDVVSYVDFIKKTVGITHEDELIKAIEVLARQVHPLALGNVARFIAQSRMIAKKLMKTHKEKADDHRISEIVEHLTAKLYFHSHAINRKEALEELKLDVLPSTKPELETAMWDLYLDFEEEFRSLQIHWSKGDLIEQEAAKFDAEAKQAAQDREEIVAALASATEHDEVINSLRAATQYLRGQLEEAQTANDATKVAEIAGHLQQAHEGLAKAETQRFQLRQTIIGAISAEQAAKRSAPTPLQQDYDLLYSIVESDKRSSSFTVTERHVLLPVQTAPGQTWVKRETLSAKWAHLQGS